MPENQEAQHWFILLNGKRYGPYALAALVKGVEKGVIGPRAGVWRPGWAQWRTAGDVPELFKLEPPPVDELEPPPNEGTQEAEETEEKAETLATSPGEPGKAQEEEQGPE